MPRTANTPAPPTASELDLLRLLWRIGPADARRVHEALAQERPDATYSGQSDAHVHTPLGDRAPPAPSVHRGCGWTAGLPTTPS